MRWGFSFQPCPSPAIPITMQTAQRKLGIVLKRHPKGPLQQLSVQHTDSAWIAAAGFFGNVK